MKELEKTGSTVEQAVQAGLEELGLEREDVECEVLDKGSKGFLGFGRRPARVKLRYDPLQCVERATERFLCELLRLMGLTAETTLTRRGSRIQVQLAGQELEELALRERRLLRALQHLLNRVANNLSERLVSIKVSAENVPEESRSRRKSAGESAGSGRDQAGESSGTRSRSGRRGRQGERAERGERSGRSRRSGNRAGDRLPRDPAAVAQATIDRAIASGSAAITPPLNAEEHRLVQAHIQRHDGVSAVTRRRGDQRRIVVTPKTSITAGETPTPGSRSSRRAGHSRRSGAYRNRRRRSPNGRGAGGRHSNGGASGVRAAENGAADARPRAKSSGSPAEQPRDEAAESQG
jgi:spoIIIJ-associated protein